MSLKSTIEVSCTTFQLQAAWIEELWDGRMFECQCGPMSDAAMAGIEHAAACKQHVRLVSPESSIILSEVQATRIGDTRWMRIKGKVERR